MRKLYHIFRNPSEYLYPELMNLPLEVRQQLLSNVTKRADLPWRELGIVASMILFFFGGVLYSQMYLPTGGWVEDIINTVALIWFTSTIFLLFVFIRRSNKRWLNGELNRLRIRPQRCLPCGYDLRGTPDESTSCPECGAAIAAVSNDTNDDVAADEVTGPPAEPGAEGGDD